MRQLKTVSALPDSCTASLSSNPKYKIEELAGMTGSHPNRFGRLPDSSMFAIPIAIDSALRPAHTHIDHDNGNGQRRRTGVAVDHLIDAYLDSTLEHAIKQPSRPTRTPHEATRALAQSRRFGVYRERQSPDQDSYQCIFK